VVADRVRAALGDDLEDPKNDRIMLVHRSQGPSDRPEHTELWTYSTWWFSRGPEADAACSWRWIDQVNVPVALIQAGSDPLIADDEASRLAELARSSGARPVIVRQIPGANHIFDRRESEAVRAASDYVDLLDEIQDEGGGFAPSGVSTEAR
jgi:pimeloyl-ACP methyl ester carboxylesterase